MMLFSGFAACSHPCAGTRENQSDSNAFVSLPGKEEGSGAVREHKERTDPLLSALGTGRFKCSAPINANVNHRGLFLLPWSRSTEKREQLSSKNRFLILKRQYMGFFSISHSLISLPVLVEGSAPLQHMGAARPPE